MKSAVFYRHTEIKDLVLMQGKAEEIQNSCDIDSNYVSSLSVPKHNKVKEKKTVV